MPMVHRVKKVEKRRNFNSGIRAAIDIYYLGQPCEPAPVRSAPQLRTEIPLAATNNRR